MGRSLQNAFGIIGLGDKLTGDVRQKQDLSAIQNAFSGGGTQQEQVQQLITQNPRAFLNNADSLTKAFAILGQGNDPSDLIRQALSPQGQTPEEAQQAETGTPLAPTTPRDSLSGPTPTEGMSSEERLATEQKVGETRHVIRGGLQETADNLQEEIGEAPPAQDDANSIRQRLLDVAETIPDQATRDRFFDDKLVKKIFTIGKSIDTAKSALAKEKLKAALKAETEKLKQKFQVGLEGFKQTGRKELEGIKQKGKAVTTIINNKANRKKLGLSDSFATSSLQRDANGKLIITQPKGKLSFRIGADGSIDFSSGDGVTTSTQTQAEKDVKTFGESVRLLGDLESQLNGKVVGLFGVLKDLSNRVPAQLSKSFFFEDRARFVDTLRTTRLALERAVKVGDTRFSDADRKYIFEVFPSTGIFESKENAQVALEVLKTIFIRRLGAAADTLGVDPKIDKLLPPEDFAKAITKMTNTKDASGKQLMSDDDAVEIMISIYPGMFE